MSDKTLPRPPQATFLGGVVVATSVLLVLFAFDRVAGLGSIEAQEEAQAFADAQGGLIGLSADGWQSVLRVLCSVAGCLSVVTAYLGWRVLQRDRGARLALSVLIPFVLVAGFAIVSLVPAAMAVSVVLLWRTPVKEWFDGTVAPPRPETVSRRREATPTPTPTPTPQVTATPVPAYAPPPTQAAAVPAYAPPPVVNPYAPAAADKAASARPGTVNGAAVVTIVTSGLVFAFLAVVLLLVIGDRSAFERSVSDEISSQSAYRDLDLDAATVAGVVIGASTVLLVWSAAAVVLAVLTLRGSNGARITLVVSSIAAALLGVLAALAVVPLVVTAAGIAVSVLLLRRDSAAWFAARKGS